jgi:flagellar biosynthetic protein FliP
MSKRLWTAGIFAMVLLLGETGFSYPMPPGLTPATPPAGTPWLPVPAAASGGVPWTIVVVLTVITLIPAILLAMTPFARLLVIFHFLRQALGTQTIPTNQTLIGLALFLTWFLMAPVGTAVYRAAIVPLQNGSIDPITAVERGAAPMRDFMLKFAREKDLALFVELAHEPRPHTPADLSMRVVVPAYMISELKAGFQIGAVLFIPFLVIDMAVASITTSIGMIQLPPVVISTPLKILVFVMADGWHLLVGSIMKSFY